MSNTLYDATTTHLLQVISTEIARDGGACLVTSIKDYLPCSGKRFNSWLAQSQGPNKLLSFLEHFEDLFQVDRGATPHWVILKDQRYVLKESFCQEIGQEGDKTDSQVSQEASTQQALLDKILYVLRKRQSRLQRRHQDSSNCPQQASNAESHKVNVPWLLKQCCWEVHALLRCRNWYRQGAYPSGTSHPSKIHAVASPEWIDLVLGEFEQFLRNEPANQLLELQQRQVWLLERESTGHVTEDADYLDQLESHLTALVLRDGATQVALSLLLHRHESLQQILGGRDFWEIVQRHPERFGELHITRGAGPDILIRARNTSSVANNDSDEESRSVEGEDSPDCRTTEGPTGGRMKVDTVGLYSVANTKWGTAMANIMVQCCRRVGWEPATTAAIDLTASVGGMTLGLAKTRAFAQVVAVEIDTKRAQLCQDNLDRHGFGDRAPSNGNEPPSSVTPVQVWNRDSMEIVPTLPRHSCIVIDPPWGGVDYKLQIQNKSLMPGGLFQMGQWILEDILEKIYHNLSPSIVGLRLPVNLVLDSFLDGLRERGLEFETLTIRKLSVQLFAVIHLVHNTMDKPEDLTAL